MYRHTEGKIDHYMLLWAVIIVYSRTDLFETQVNTAPVQFIQCEGGLLFLLVSIVCSECTAALFGLLIFEREDHR